MAGTTKNSALRTRASYRSSPNRVDLRALLAVVALGLGGCSAKFDPQIYAENTAKYMTKPLHKALYINTADFAMYPRWDAPNAQEALAQAERDCVEASKQRGTASERCAPFYTDETRLIDPAIYE